MGGAGLALYGPDAYFLNPAGLAALAPRESSLQASYESLLGAASRTGLSYSRGAGASVFSAGLIYQDSGAGLQTLDAAGRVANPSPKITQSMSHNAKPSMGRSGGGARGGFFGGGGGGS